MNVCPFVKSTSTGAMKKLARNSSLISKAQYCPIMGPALKEEINTQTQKRNYSTPSKVNQAQATESFTDSTSASASAAAAAAAAAAASAANSNAASFNSKEEAYDYNGFLKNSQLLIVLKKKIKLLFGVQMII
ncbi:unnamed protein product [[Candida] boidinii]|nr:unnamed protein product [[Candida] boidinii]